MKLKIKQITAVIEKIAPTVYAESWDNPGLLVGDAEAEVEKALVALDCSEAVIDEAIEKKAGLIITHHPLIFVGVKKMVPTDETARLVIKAIKNDIAIYTAHTNLDNVFCGLNSLIADEINLKERSILEPQNEKLYKIVTFIPKTHVEYVRNELFKEGFGHIGNYDSCSFSTEGEGTFRANKDANPFVGKLGKIHIEPEYRVEFIVAEHQRNQALNILKTAHPYEEPAIDIFSLENSYEKAGSGMVGTLEKPMDEIDFLQLVKEKMLIPVLRHSHLTGKKIQKVAICSGAGSFLIKNAIHCNADAFITGDVKYHDFFVPENRLLLIDAGHYETEQFSRLYLYTILKENFTNFAVQISERGYNAVNYLI